MIHFRKEPHISSHILHHSSSSLFLVKTCCIVKQIYNSFLSLAADLFNCICSEFILCITVCQQSIAWLITCTRTVSPAYCFLCELIWPSLSFFFTVKLHYTWKFSRWFFLPNASAMTVSTTCPITWDGWMNGWWMYGWVRQMKWNQMEYN